MHYFLHQLRNAKSRIQSIDYLHEEQGYLWRWRWRERKRGPPETGGGRNPPPLLWRATAAEEKRAVAAELPIRSRNLFWKEMAAASLNLGGFWVNVWRKGMGLWRWGLVRREQWRVKKLLPYSNFEVERERRRRERERCGDELVGVIHIWKLWLHFIQKHKINKLIHVAK